MKVMRKREDDVDASAPSADAVLRAQAAVLSFVAAHEGGNLTIPFVARSLTPEMGEGCSETAIEIAVRDLVAAGILGCEGGILKAAPH